MVKIAFKQQNTGFFQKLKEWFKSAYAKVKAFVIKRALRLGERIGTGDSLKDTWAVLRPISIRVIAVILVAIIIATGYNTVNKNLFSSMSKRDDTPVLLIIDSGQSMSSVARELKELGLIRSTWGIKLLADFTNKSNKVKSGEYILDKTMTVTEILDAITQPKPVMHTVRITFPEGYTVEDMADILERRGVIDSADAFLSLVKTGEAFKDYYFVPPLLGRGNVRYMLEGFLFADTYEFYTQSTPTAVIERLLNRFSQIYTVEYAAQAEKLGMSMNEVITLASIIEKESLSKDFAKVSAVFHNRLKADMSLSSDATLQYVLKTKRLLLTQEELATPSPFNTHMNKGLPPGPICSPSKKAIEAALFPDQEIINGKYYYFTLTDPYTGDVAFSKTYEEHQRIVSQYRDLWAKYDRERNNG